MNPDALIIFCRYPEYGRVKTRIAASLGDDFALGLYTAFLKDVLSIPSRADKIIAVDRKGGIADHSFMSGSAHPVVRQQGEDLGIRMLNAIHDACSAGYERVALMGCDFPDLPEECIDDAFRLLHNHDAVLGPSEDGGYYLIGFNKGSCEESFFSAIEWGTPSVFQRTVEKIRSAGKKLALTPSWLDIDTVDDLRKFYERKRSSGELSSYTMKYLMDTIRSGKIELA